MPTWSQPGAPRRCPIGLGLRAAHVEAILASPTLVVDGFEILAENYDGDGGRPRDALAQLGARYPLVPHAVSTYIGSADGLDRAQLRRLRRLADAVDAPWVTDHLCWGAAGGRTSHDLLPLPSTPAVVRLCADAIRAVQDALGRPFAIENVSSYLAWRESTMPEWEFVAAVADAADCGILLDVNNVYVAAVNHGFDPRTYLAHVPAARVVQLHLAGHSVEDGYLLDTHDQPVADPVWALFAEALARLGPIPTIIEWDGDVPPLEVALAEVARARAIADRVLTAEARDVA